MGQPAYLKNWHHDQICAIALKSFICRSSCVNPLDNNSKKQDELAGGHSLVERCHTRSNKTFTSPKAPTPPLISPLTKNLFVKSMRIFVELTQVKNQE